MKKIGILITIFLIVIFFYVCSKSPTSTETPGLSSEQSATSTDEDTNTGTTTGILQIILTDNPIEDAIHVNVQIDQIKVHMASEESWKPVSGPIPDFDLLSLINDKMLIVDVPLNIGHYNQIRFSVGSGSIEIDLGDGPKVYPLKIPSAEIKIPIQLWIKEGSTTVIDLDFDAEKSVKFHRKGKDYEFILRPVIKVLKVETF